MLKKIICLLCVILVTGSLTTHAKSLETDNLDPQSIQNIYQLENGDFLIEKRPESVFIHRGIVSGNKQYEYVDSDGVVRWTATLTGTFSYNGSSATCTAASCITSVQQGNWHETYNHAYPSGNTAQADITMVRKVLFVTVQTEIAHLVLSCDANGNLS